MSASPEPTDPPAIASQELESNTSLELEEQRALLTSLVGRAPVGMALFDRQFRCLHLNDALACLVERPAAAALGRTPSELVPGLWPMLAPLFERSLREPVADAELSGSVETSGEVRWWLVNTYPVPLPGGDEGFALVATDITARKRAEAALAAQQSELSAVFASIDEAFCIAEVIVDADGSPVDYRFIQVNPLFEETTGLTDVPGRTALELVPNLERYWIDTYARVGLGGETLRFEHGSDAIGRWFDVFATPLGSKRFALVFKDRTERRSTELRLVESEQRFRTMADELPILVWQHDATGHQEWVNSTFCAYFGVDRGEMLAERWRSLIHPDHDTYADDFLAAVRNRTDFRTEVRVLRADGQWRWIESVGRARFSPEAEFLGHIGTSVDVTERRSAEESLRATAALNAYRAGLADTLRVMTDPAAIEAQATHLLGHHLQAWRVHYAELEASGEYGIVTADFHRGPTSVVGRHRLDDSGQRLMDELRAGRVVVIDDVAGDDRFSPAEQHRTLALDIGAYVMVPIVHDGRTTATMVVHHRHAHDWTDNELAAVSETADRISVAIERARAEIALREKHRRAELVANLLADLEQEPTVTAQLQRLTEALVPGVADYATVEAPGEEQPLLAISHRQPDKLEILRTLRTRHRIDDDTAYSISRAAAGESQLLTVVSPELRAEYATNDDLARLLEKLAPRSHIAVPIDLGGGIRGALLAGVTDPERSSFTVEDLEFIRETAQRAGVILAAGRLRHLQHDISLRLQRALLPDSIQWHPNLEIAARYRAASDFLEVGGDWYDTFAWPDGRIGVIVGDVVGHNLDSAAAMGRLRAATSALAGRLEPSPSALLSAIDDYARGPDGTSFATVVCLVVDPATGTLTYSSAGHPPPLLVTPDRYRIRLDQAKSPPLCSLHRGPWPEATITMEPGALVVMYSDGLVERRREDLDVGIARLERLTLELLEEPVGTIADKLTEGMNRHSPPEDDVVVACLRYTPTMAQLHLQMPARTDELGKLRAELREWLEARHITDVHRDDILLAVGEACTNAVEHAYHDRPAGMIHLDLSDHCYHVTAQISDQGAWRPPGPHNRLRGRGTHIMRSLSTRFTRNSDVAGTRVELNLAVPPRQLVASSLLV